jgi:DNA (cytosine-5)-methyltransferase 1
VVAAVKPRLLDAFCCQGGASRGYADAGFDVVGVDLDPQPRYPYTFVQDDAVAFIREHGHEFDVIHASPPCQSYLNLTRANEAMGRNPQHADLIEATREALSATGKPWVIENVPNAPLIDPVRLCGTSFALPLRRHRHFESNLPITGLPCEHKRFTTPRYWTSWRPNGEHRLSTVVQVYGNAGGVEHWPAALGVDWMDRRGMAECLPPAYTQHVGAQIICQLEDVAA